MNEISFILGSITKATKAKRLLSSSKIRSTVIKSADAENGECAHGLKLAKEDMYRAVIILRNNGIEYRLENDIS